MNFNIFWVFRKINIFWGMKALWIFFGFITKFDYIKRSFLCILGSFLKIKVQNWGIFFGSENFKYFLGVFEIPEIFWG